MPISSAADSLLNGDDMQAALALPILAAWPEDASYHEAEQATAIGAVLVRTLHRHLMGATIAYVFRQAMATHDKTTLAKASKAGNKLTFFTGYDLCVDVNHETWLKLAPDQKVALIDHELCHFGVEDTDKGTRYVLLGHDVEEFGAIVNRWGLWKPDLKVFARTCSEQVELFAAERDTVTFSGPGIDPVTLKSSEFSETAERISGKRL